LTLPALSGAVPVRLGAPANERASALALMLLDCGLLPPALRTRERTQLDAACSAALQGWIDARCAGLKVLDLRVSTEMLTAWGSAAEGKDYITLSCFADGISEVVCGGTLEHLYRIDPRLPKAVLDRLERVAWRSVPVLSCSDQIDLAEWLLWGSCHDETEHAEENELEGDDLASYLASVPSRAEVLAGLPTWLTERTNDPIDDKGLARIARKVRDPLTAEIIETLAELAALWTPMVDQHDQARNDGGQFVGFGALVRYAATDHFGLIAESLCQYAMESGEGYDVVHRQAIRLGDASGLKDWLSEIEPWLQACRLTDHLLSLLGRADSTNGAATHE